MDRFAPATEFKRNQALVVAEPCSHFVHFYENDGRLIDSLEEFILSGLVARDACIVIATEPHRIELRHRLEKAGINIAAEIFHKRFIDLDARATLDRFLVEGWPDSEAFEAVVREVITAARAGGRPVRAFGEMVALLWDEGREEAAVRLEAMWNNLIPTEDLSLFCAYPSTVQMGSSQLIQEVVAAHSSVI